jgi:hypothetical protein
MELPLHGGGPLHFALELLLYCKLLLALSRLRYSLTHFYGMIRCHYDAPRAVLFNK